MPHHDDKVDQDGFPLLPPLPAARDLPIEGRSLARLVTQLHTAVLSLATPDATAMLVFVDRRPVDGLARRGDRCVRGVDALDEIADLPVEGVSVKEVQPDVAAALGGYFEETIVRDVPATLVQPEPFIRSLGRPGQRGCSLIRAREQLGLVFLSGGEVTIAYRPGADQAGGLEKVADLLADPEARIFARIGRASNAAPLDSRPDLSGRREAILKDIRARLGRNAAPVEALFMAAPPTPGGLRQAAESVRSLQIRLVSPATLNDIADGALRALDEL